MKCLKNQQIKESRWVSSKALNEALNEVVNKALSVVKKNTQIKIAIKMLVRNNQTLEEISEIVGLDLDALRELKRSI